MEEADADDPHPLPVVVVIATRALHHSCPTPTLHLEVPGCERISRAAARRLALVVVHGANAHVGHLAQ